MTADQRPQPPASEQELERFQRELARILAAVAARRLRRVA
jgi:dGTP triphosphohydrolase